jgi:hypothetical protein
VTRPGCLWSDALDADAGGAVRRLTLIAVAILSALALALAGCGDSDSEEAQDAVCDARAGIQSSVADLRALTPATATADQVQGELQSIQSDLATIDENAARLDEDRRDQVETATAQFKLQLQDLARDLGGLTVPEARQRFRTSVADLESAYRSSLEPIDCG